MRFLLVSALVLASATQAYSQSLSGSESQQNERGKWYFGISGGYRFNQMSFSDIDEEVYPDNKTLGSGLFSVFLQYDFGREHHFSVRPEVSLLRRGGKIENIAEYNYGDDVENMFYTLKANYVDIRVPLIYNFGKTGWTIRPYVYVAPVFGFPTGGSAAMQADYVDGQYSGYEFDLSKASIASTYIAGMVGIGARYQFDISGNTLFLGVEASYEYGFTNTYGDKEKDGEATVNRTWSLPSRELEGSRKFSGFEIKATLGIPFSVFKKKQKPTPEPVYVEPAAEEEPVVEEKPCYTLEEINDFILKGESVEGKTICAINSINFDFGKSTIKESSYEYLDNLANTLIRLNARIEIKGHTDNVGTEEFNMNLSKERALAVMDYLTGKGVSRDKLTYSYYGMSKPLSSNESEEGRTMNRRVEFEILR